MRTKSLPCLFYATLLALILQVFATPVIAASPAPQAIPIGAIVSLTGFDSNVGHQVKAGYEFAAEDVNRSGGVFVKEYGKKIPIEVMVQDMESNPTKATSRMEWLHSSKKVVAFAGTTMISAGQGVGEGFAVNPSRVSVSRWGQE